MDQRADVAVKATKVRNTLEREKLEQSQKATLRIISTAASKFRSKFIKVEDPSRSLGDTEASNVRMYETHFPGFCYRKDGQYRKRNTSSKVCEVPDPEQCCEKVKAMLFTKNDLDLRKVMCLHLLGTHVRNKRNIQKKDGRACSYVKSSVNYNRRHTLQALSQKAQVFNPTKLSGHENMLPRYVLDVQVVDRTSSFMSFKSFDFEPGSSDEDSKKRRKCQVPIYMNNEVNVIIASVLEALEAVNSPKLSELLNLANSPEELRNMLAHEEIQEFIVELAANPMLTRPTSYDFVITHPMFDKIPDTGTMETVAQVLEVNEDTALRYMIGQIRKSISQRHAELVNSNIIPGKRKPNLENQSRVSFISSESSPKMNQVFKVLQADIYTEFPFQNPGKGKRLIGTHKGVKKSSRDAGSSQQHAETTSQAGKIYNRNGPGVSPRGAEKVINIVSGIDDTTLESLKEAIEDEENEISKADRKSEVDYILRRYNMNEEPEGSKYDLRSLNNSQRILLGLKVASLKTRPINMHQFENKKKINMSAIIAPIVRPVVTDINYNEHSPENHISNFTFDQDKPRTHRSDMEVLSSSGLENLTRGLLAGLRQEISVKENKRRLKEFIDTKI